MYIFGDHSTIPDESKLLTVRVHDECNGSDVFGSDICTCRPYLIHGIEECIRAGQSGGCGVIVYFRKEGRALGEVTKYLVRGRVSVRLAGWLCAAVVVRASVPACVRVCVSVCMRYLVHVCCRACLPV